MHRVLRFLFCASVILFCFLNIVANTGCGTSNTRAHITTTPPPPATPELLFSRTIGKIKSYKVDVTTGLMQPGAVTPLDTSVSFFYPMVSDPLGIFLFAIEQKIHPDLTSASTIQVFVIDASTGALTRSGSPFPLSDSATGNLTVTVSGLFVYVPLYDGLHGLAFDRTNQSFTELPGSPIQLMANEWFDSVAVEPTGRFLYARSPNVPPPTEPLVFNIDQTTGALTLLEPAPEVYATVYSPGEIIRDSSGMIPSQDFLYGFSAMDYYGIAGTTHLFSIDQASGVLAYYGPDNGYMEKSVLLDPSLKYFYSCSRMKYGGMDFAYIAVYPIYPDTGVWGGGMNPPTLTLPKADFSATIDAASIVYVTQNWVTTTYKVDASGFLQPLQSLNDPDFSAGDLAIAHQRGVIPYREALRSKGGPGRDL